MIDFSNYFQKLAESDCELANVLAGRTKEVMAQRPHGDVAKWMSVIESMPNITPSSINLDTPAVMIGKPNDCDDAIGQNLADKLMEFHPWRKGPWEIFGVNIETEWRSDLKWDRVKDHIAPLNGKLVLDVGCGNGYFCYRMVGAGAKAVVGIDPYMLFVAQYQAINHYAKCDRATVLPLKIEDLPINRPWFDTVLSMGVLYHRRDPMEHLENVLALTLPGGEVILETLVLDKVGDEVLVPTGRYAKMRNVWNIPTPTVLTSWMKQAGFVNVRLVDVTKTTHLEQKKTPWMEYESLAEYLDPVNENLTIEGHPAPVRAVVIAQKP